MRRLYRGYSWLDIARMYDPHLALGLNNDLESILGDAFHFEAEYFSADDITYEDVRAMGEPFASMSGPAIQAYVDELASWNFHFGNGLRDPNYVDTGLQILTMLGYLIEQPQSSGASLYRCARGSFHHPALVHLAA